MYRINKSNTTIFSPPSLLLSCTKTIVYIIFENVKASIEPYFNRLFSERSKEERCHIFERCKKYHDLEEFMRRLKCSVDCLKIPVFLKGMIKIFYIKYN